MIGAMFPYACTTRGITVRVAVSFQSETSDPVASRWFWVYHIRIENGGEAEVQLIDRRWEITDGRGAKHLVEGSGVVGEQPVIVPGASFDYVSGCPLATPSGRMIGSFGMIDAEGHRFSIAVPEFPLLGPAVSR
jgi:ApaG protein